MHWTWVVVIVYLRLHCEEMRGRLALGIGCLILSHFFSYHLRLLLDLQPFGLCVSKFIIHTIYAECDAGGKPATVSTHYRGKPQRLYPLLLRETFHITLSSNLRPLASLCHVSHADQAEYRESRPP